MILIYCFITVQILYVCMFGPHCMVFAKPYRCRSGLQSRRVLLDHQWPARHSGGGVLGGSHVPTGSHLSISFLFFSPISIRVILKSELNVGTGKNWCSNVGIEMCLCVCG
ncbi:hypothetical protein QVD17_06349 [Tagetes erecta]|uniref:Uncharacterized protein n=1 Tax=Tagetes erecta TaxID=13708 RepID=A0AAD8PC64_TARER|nr:hypothetical protein QVD17_06349 [Tagetes erecta]